MSAEQALNKAEFAGRIGVSLRTLDRLMADGKVRPIRIRGRVVFRESHVSQFLDRRDPNKKGHG